MNSETPLPETAATPTPCALRLWRTTALLLAQTRAFSRLPVADLILTHLDEETAWGKLWNLVLGTNYALGFLSAGQNVPGRFCAAQAELLCAPLFGGK